MLFIDTYVHTYKKKLSYGIRQLQRCNVQDRDTILPVECTAKKKRFRPKTTGMSYAVFAKMFGNTGLQVRVSD